MEDLRWVTQEKGEITWDDTPSIANFGYNELFLAILLERKEYKTTAKRQRANGRNDFQIVEKRTCQYLILGGIATPVGKSNWRKDHPILAYDHSDYLVTAFSDRNGRVYPGARVATRVPCDTQFQVAQVATSLVNRKVRKKFPRLYIMQHVHYRDDDIAKQMHSLLKLQPCEVPFAERLVGHGDLEFAERLSIIGNYD